MKTIKLITLSIVLLGFVGTASAQDDFYPSSKKNSDKNNNQEKPLEETISEDEYSTATDYYIDSRENERERAYNERMGINDSTTYYEDENGNVQITNNYYNGDNYDFDNEYYDYEYSSRIKRFRRNNGRFGYYDDYYTNYYWYDYDPYFYGNSIYSSYGWWNPRPWGWGGGWSYYGGWSLGWSWGWGFSGNYGYCGVGNYWNNGWYGSSYWNGYNNGFNDGCFASNNYYNSYDHNSHYYGPRGSTSSSSGYGGRKTLGSASSVNVVASSKPRSFGQKYEAAVRNTSVNHNTNSLNGKPRNTGVTAGKSVYNKPGTRPVTGSNGYNKPGSRPVSGGTNVYGKPRVTTKSKSGYSKGNSYGSSRPTNNKPRTSTYNKPKSSRPSYSKPRNTYKRPKTSYNKPKSSRPSYNKPSGNYNRGGSRSSGSRTRSSGGGSRSKSSGGRRR